jgi:hypothetical protein
MNGTKKVILVFIFGLLYGISWGSIYLFFSSIHGMTKMFNEKFLFGVASLLKAEVSTVTTGFIFSFIDGYILGILIGLLLARISKSASATAFNYHINN